MPDSNQYSVPLYKSWAIELKHIVNSSNFKISTGHAIQVTSAYWGFNTHDHLRASPTQQGDRLLADFAANSELAYTRATQLGHPAEVILAALQTLHAEEQDVLKSLAKRLVRNVLNNCDCVQGEYCHSALLKIVDAELCQKVVFTPFFVDFLYGSYPFTAQQSFAEVKPHPGMHGHFMINPEAALNVAAFLHRPALEILTMKHSGEKK